MNVDNPYNIYSTHNIIQTRTEADMYYSDMDENLKSSFSRNNLSYANLTSESQLPDFGLKARELLNNHQMKKLARIRAKRIKNARNFIKD